MIAELSPYVDAFIPDTYDPETGASGTTGKTHDWTISRKFVELSTKPVILAGGLNADNVREAIVAVKPAGVDAHTGVEGANGRKDSEMIQRFVSEARAGFTAIQQSALLYFYEHQIEDGQCDGWAAALISIKWAFGFSQWPPILDVGGKKDLDAAKENPSKISIVFSIDVAGQQDSPFAIF